VKLVHLVGFITKKFVTMHGHMKVKYLNTVCSIAMLSYYVLDTPDGEKKSRDNTVGPLLGYLAATHGFGSKEIREARPGLHLLATEHMTSC
jgi:hypothetical protein